MPEVSIPISMVTPYGTLAFNDLTSSHPYIVKEFKLSRTSRANIEHASQQHGGILPSKFFHGYLMPIISGILLASDAATRAQMMDDLTAHCASILSTPGLLKWTPSGKTERQLPIRCYDDPIPDEPGGGLAKQFHLGLVSDLAHAQSSALYTEETTSLLIAAGEEWDFGIGGSVGGTAAWSFGGSITPAWLLGTTPLLSGGRAFVTSRGSVEASPVVDIYGVISDPIIQNLSTQELVSLPGLSIPADNFVRIDMRTGAVTYNGTSSTLLRYIDNAVSTFWQLQPGNNTIRLRGTGFDAAAKAVITWRDAWA